MYPLIIVLFVILILLTDNKESFNSAPTEEEKNKYANIILSDPKYFENNITKVKIKYPWIDIITLEEIRQLIYNKNLTRETVIATFN
jgi:hypothetical protein